MITEKPRLMIDQLKQVMTETMAAEVENDLIRTFARKHAYSEMMMHMSFISRKSDDGDLSPDTRKEMKEVLVELKDLEKWYDNERAIVERAKTE